MATADLPVERDSLAARAIPLSLTACLAVGLFLRIWGIEFGLPELYYWDEPTVLNRAMRFGTGDLNPHFFYYPALYMYVLFGAAGGYFVYGRLIGLFAGAQDFASAYFIDPSGVYLTGRLTTALLGTAAIYATYVLGKRYFDAKTGVVAASVLCVLPLHSSHSHIAITDVPQALLICLAAIACHDVLVRGRTRDYLVAGALIGLGTATKYTAIIQLVTLGTAYVARSLTWSRDDFRAHTLLRLLRGSGPLWLGVAACVVGFAVGSPYNVIELSAFIADFRAQAALSAGDAKEGALVLRSAFHDLGAAATLLAGFGLFQAVRKFDRAMLVFLSFPATYALAMVRITRSFARYLLPQSAFLAVLAAYGLWELASLLAARLGSRSLIAGALVVLALLQPLAVSIGWDEQQANHLDTRTISLAWADANLEHGETVIVQSVFDRTFLNTPLVTNRTLERLERVLPTGGRFGEARDKILDAWRKRVSFEDAGWSEDAAVMQNAGARYVFLTGSQSPPPEVSRWLASSSRVLHEFKPELHWVFHALFPDLGRELLPAMPPDLTILELH